MSNLWYLLISCAFVSEEQLEKRLDPDGDGVGIEDCDNTNSTIVGPTTWFKDADGDGFGDPNVFEAFCTPPDSSWVYGSSDCNDDNANVNIQATEICDGIDNDCDGEIDDQQGSGLGGTIFYYDGDGDGYGTEFDSIEACLAPFEYVEVDGDCDDQDNSRFPDAEEVCNGIDNDCDGEIDNGVTAVFYEDADGDGYGVLENVIEACEAPVGFVSQGTDCNDSDPQINPETIWYEDADGDGFGTDLGTGIVTCDPGFGFVLDNTDCDDFSSLFNPVAADPAADGLDQNCDGMDACYYDGDGDGVGQDLSYFEALGVPPTTADCMGENESPFNTDCNDNPNNGGKFVALSRFHLHRCSRCL